MTVRECECVYTHTWEGTAEQRVKRMACTDNEGHHSLDIVFRTLFPAAKLGNVLFMSWPKGLHSGKTTAYVTH